MIEGERPFEIGPARREEIGAVARLASASLLEAWSECAFAAMLDAPEGVFRVARPASAAGVAGFLLAQRVLDELHVLSLAVAPAWRRRGVGTLLLAAALGEPPARSILLEVRPSNAVARQFYHALGFAEVGLRRGYYPDGEDALLFTRGARHAVWAAGGGRRT